VSKPGQGPTLAALHREVRRALSDAGIDAPEVDARLIVEHLTATTRTDAVARSGMAVEMEVLAAVDAAVARRVAGEPVHRILGWREFYGLRLALSAETLEPRPDTETLVDLALPVARERAAATGGCRILDLGTGTGAVALALLSAVPQATASATDISEDALATARRNAQITGAGDRLAAFRSDWFASVEGVFDLIVSNPPYIAEAEMGGLPREVREHDPPAALVGGADGLDAYRVIAAGAAGHLADAGAVAVEIGYRQRTEVTAIFESHGFTLADAACDLGGHDRALLFRTVDCGGKAHK
jgi:release factor glutamine methyltransferase